MFENISDISNFSQESYQCVKWAYKKSCKLRKIIESVKKKAYDLKHSLRQLNRNLCDYVARRKAFIPRR